MSHTYKPKSQNHPLPNGKSYSKNEKAQHSVKQYRPPSQPQKQVSVWSLKPNEEDDLKDGLQIVLANARDSLHNEFAKELLFLVQKKALVRVSQKSSSFSGRGAHAQNHEVIFGINQLPGTTLRIVVSEEGNSKISNESQQAIFSSSSKLEMSVQMSEESYFKFCRIGDKETQSFASAIFGHRLSPSTKTQVLGMAFLAIADFWTAWHSNEEDWKSLLGPLCREGSFIKAIANKGVRMIEKKNVEELEDSNSSESQKGEESIEEVEGGDEKGNCNVE